MCCMLLMFLCPFKQAIELDLGFSLRVKVIRLVYANTLD